MTERLVKAWRSLMASGYLHVLSSNVLIQLLGFASVLFVAKMLEPVELALIRSTQAYSAVLAILVGCGLTAPILRYCADSSLDLSFKQYLLSVALRRTVLAAASIVVISGCLIYFFVADQEQRSVYSTFVLVLPAFSLTSLFFVYLQARQQFSLLARSQVLIKLIAVIGLVLATWAWGLYGFLCATLLAAYIGLVPLWSACEAHFKKSHHQPIPRDFNNLAFHSLLGMGLTVMAQSSDFLLLQLAGADKHDVGLYSLATIFLMAAMTVTGAFQSVVTPKFTALLDQPEIFQLRLRQWTLRASILGFGAAAACFMIAWVLDRYFFGERYAGFVAILCVLLLKHIVWSVYAIAGAALAGAGILKSGTLISAITTLLCFLIGYPLCVRFGVWGAAWTQVVISCVSLALIWYAQKIGLARYFDKLPS